MRSRTVGFDGVFVLAVLMVLPAALAAGEVEAPPRPQAENRLLPRGTEVDLGWWKVGLDWRRHPGVCLIDP